MQLQENVVPLVGKYFYSPSTNGFYHSGLHSNMPGDCKEISEEAWSQLLAAQSKGRRIKVDMNGNSIGHGSNINNGR